MRSLPVLILLLVVAGCSDSITSDTNVAAGIKRVRVVAMEPPPLQGLPARFQAAPSVKPGAVTVAQTAGSGATTAGAAPLRGARLTGSMSVVALAPLLVDLAMSSYCNDPRPASSETIPLPEAIWVPTVIMATEARAQLAEAHIDATLEPGLKPTSCNRDPRPGPVRTWYDDTGPNLPHAAPEVANPTYVLEVAIGNYELSGSDLLLQVMMRLTDPVNGRLVGRARAANTWQPAPIGSFDEALSGDAAPFKATIAAEARTLVRDCLNQLGLVPES
jgi:hypothetical protein